MLIGVAPAPGHAQDGAMATEYQLSIPAQPLGSALNAFARETGMRLAYPAELVTGRQSQGLVGRYDRSHALSRLLDGTGLAFRISNDTVTLSDAGASASPGTDVEGLLLDPITVTAAPDPRAVSGAGFLGAPDWIYETPGGVSVLGREGIDDAQPRDSGDLFANMAGVNAAGATQNPGISVNIRGLQDQNRVTSTIDGARQNFQQGGHGYTSNVYVDPSLLRMVEVEKGAATGVGSGGAIGGVVNYRTLEARDLLQEGRTYGGNVDLTTGTNAYDFSGTASVAAQLTERLDIVAALSHESLDAYEVGGNGSLPETSEGFYEDNGGEAVFTGSDTWSGLLKTGWDLAPDQRLSFGVVAYDTEFTTSTIGEGYRNTNEVRNLTGTLAYDWTPDDPLVDLHARLWYNRTENAQFREARTTYGAFDIDYAIDSYGVSLENSSRFALSSGDLTLHYGLEAFTDTTDTGVETYDDDDLGNESWFTGPNPNGDRAFYSAFMRATYAQPDRFEAWIGGRYDHYDLSGETSYAACLAPRPDGRCGRRDRVYMNTDVDADGGAFSPEIGAAWTIRDGVQVFGKYSEGYRPPSLAETLLGGGHIGNILRYTANPELEAETSRSWELGTNVSYDSLLREGDAFRLKAAWFDQRVDDFIALGLTSGTPDFENAREFSGYQYTNLDGTTRLKGLELEGNYDAGPYYVGAAYTRTLGDYPDSYENDPWGNGTGSTQQLYYIFVAPETKLSVDAGLRLMDDRLTLGARLTHVVPSEQKGQNAMAYEPQTYTTGDLYGSYELREDAALRFAINNVTDQAYVDSLNTSDFLAPGRTAMVSIDMTF